MRVLVTGGAGYIGSHTLVELLALGHELCVVDNFSNSSPEALARVREISGRDFAEYRDDIRDRAAMEHIFDTFRPQAVIHFAGLKAVGESEEIPLAYYDTNVGGTLNLLAAMDRVGCKRIVFSSSATVYGVAEYLPFDEVHPCAPANVYGRTKYTAEHVLADWNAARGADGSVLLLRYFNPVGAHPSGRIGEDPLGIPNNLLPFVAQVAVGRREKVAVFGNDYDTTDGTGVRDYIHVVDLARAHAAAIDFAETHRGTERINVGTGTGYTVLQVIEAFAAASARPVPYDIVARRPGDVATLLANPAKAHELLGWRAEYGLREICESAWHWQSNNPQGFAKS